MYPCTKNLNVFHSLKNKLVWLPSGSILPFSREEGRIAILGGALEVKPHPMLYQIHLTKDWPLSPPSLPVDMCVCLT